MIYYVIPARKGSKGFPGKNRILFKYTAELVRVFGRAVLVSSDDDEILYAAENYGFTAIRRPDEISGDNADMISVLQNVVEFKDMLPDDVIVLLYLTSPGRTISDMNRALEIFHSSGAPSLVCRTPAKTSPYMCIYENGRPVINHNLYRRQDYPKCFEIRHHVAIYRVGEIPRLNNLLFNDYTTWMDIPDPVDVDYEKDFLSFIEHKN